MSTDFNYGNSTIITTGPVKPKDRNVPMNARYRVETYADIATIPVPAVGELVFVLSDENNNNQQNIYVVKSLKASNLGVADSLVDEVVPLKTFLGTDDINLSDYVTEDELNNRGYATTTEVDQKIAGIGGGSTVEIINDLTTGGTDKALSAEQGKILKNEVNTIISDYLGNKKLIYLTQTEYNSLTEEQKNDESVVYNITDAPTGFSGILTSENGTKFKLVVSNDGTLSTKEIHEIKYGEIVLNKTSLSLNEGETETFTVSLDKAPTAEEVISISVNNSNCTVNPSSLSFTSSNYSDGQEVTVTAIHDSLSYENKTDTIILSNNNVSDKSIRVTINNIDEDPKAVSSISAVYTQGDTVVYPVTPLDSLKSNLEVTATYNDGSTNTVTDYTLSGTLAVGTSTITVTYNDKTTTFNVTVTEKNIGDSDYYVNLDFSDNSNSPIIPNLADSNLNATLNGTSLVSWENGVARITTNAAEQGLTIRDANIITNEMSIEIVFQGMDESRTNSNVIKITGLANETTAMAQFKTDGINITLNAYNDGNKAYITYFPYTFNITEKQHMLLSLKSGELVLYINGLEISRANNTYTNLSMNLIQVANYNFDGTVELFKIYKKALSSSEVTSTYNDYLNEQIDY